MKCNVKFPLWPWLWPLPKGHKQKPKRMHHARPPHHQSRVGTLIQWAYCERNYVAAISACHVEFGDKPAGLHPLVCPEGRAPLHVSRPLVPLWDLSIVLDAFSQHEICFHFWLRSQPSEWVICMHFPFSPLVCSGLQGSPRCVCGPIQLLCRSDSVIIQVFLCGAIGVPFSSVEEQRLMLCALCEL